MIGQTVSYHRIIKKLGSKGLASPTRLRLSTARVQQNQIEGIQVDIFHIINSRVKGRREVRPRSNEET
jgi:hypothetical protein